MKILEPILNRLLREPALIGAFVLATLAAIWPDASEGVQGAWLAGTTLFVRSLSTSNKSSEERVEVAKYVGLVEGEHRTMATDRPRRER